MYKYNFMLSLVTPDGQEHVAGGFDSLYYIVKFAYALDLSSDFAFHISPANVYFRPYDVPFGTMYRQLSDKIYF